SAKLLDEFISLIKFPKYFQGFKISGGAIYLEPSFSDFGQADAVVLVDNFYKKQALFIEAKVKTESKKVWSIEEEFKGFFEGIKEYNYLMEKGAVHYANLFTQLYYKLRMTKALERNGLEGIKRGVNFHECFGKEIKKIGSSKIVLKAVEDLLNYLDDSFFVLLVPDTEKNMGDFFKDIKFNLGSSELVDWDTANWGYLTWEAVEKFCMRHQMTSTLKNFEFNRGQIY
ncbi:MAG: hypothetical protein MUP98_15160, partial [Candidatus Aminicenantes bacterium]|nr:hypothetical protein [Candidatus Aminicenantes bacterium]